MDPSNHCWAQSRHSLIDPVFFREIVFLPMVVKLNTGSAFVIFDLFFAAAAAFCLGRKWEIPSDEVLTLQDAYARKKGQKASTWWFS